MSNKAANTVLWSGIEKFGSQAFQALFTIILARLLEPSDFGIMAMLTVVWFVGQILIDSGIGQSLIQKSNRSPKDFNTVFFFNLGIGIALYVILFFSAPWIAKFYEEPILTDIVRVTGFCLIFMSLSVVQGTQLTIALNFKAHAKTSFAAMIVSGLCGIGLALAGYGVWALAVQILMNSFVKMVSLWLISDWRPKWAFSKSSFLGLWNSGSKYMVASIIDILYKNLFSIVIGKRFSSADLGFFSQANSLANLPSTNVAFTIARAFYPLQCELKSSDEDLLKSFHRFLRMSCFIIFPIMLFLTILVKPIVGIFLTEKWLHATPYIQILCLAYIWQPLMVLNNHLIMIKGRFDYVLRAEIIKKALGLTAFFILLPYGIKALCYSMLIYSFVDTIVTIFFVRKLLPTTSFFSQIREIGSIIGLNLVLAAALLLIQHFISSDIWQLILGVVLSLAVYFGLAYALRFSELSFIKEFLSSKKINNNR